MLFLDDDDGFTVKCSNACGGFQPDRIGRDWLDRWLSKHDDTVLNLPVFANSMRLP